MGEHPPSPRPPSELEEFFDLSIDLLCIVGFDGYFKRVNAALERALGYPRQELFARTVFEITHPDDVPRARDAMAQQSAGENLVAFESRVICADGTVRWLEWNTIVMPERGVVYGVARDTTERRRSNAALRAAQRMLETSRDELRVLASEQAALRRVATLVARGAPSEEVFAAVGRETGEVLGVDATHLGRFDPDGTVVSVAEWGHFRSVPLGTRFPLDGDSVSLRVLQSGRTARMGGYDGVAGTIAERLREVGIRYAIGVPVSIEGRTWGVMTATSKSEEPFPAETEARLEDFTELIATAISNANAHHKLQALADEQAALRRVATLIARDTPQTEIFAAIAEEIGRLLAVDSVAMVRYEDDRSGVLVARAGSLDTPIGARAPLQEGTIAALVLDTGRAARLDDYTAKLPRPGGATTEIRSAAGAPITIEGRLWGVMIAVADELHLPADTEARVAQFTDLMATAIANTDARAEVARLADEQAALRRVATLVAEGAEPAAVFDAVAGEVAGLLDASSVTLARNAGDALLVVGTRGRGAYVQVGERYPQGGTNVTSTVLRTGRTARLDDYAAASGKIGSVARGAGTRSAVAAPVIVDGRTWGVLAAVWTDREPPPDDTEARLASFAQLLDTAIANADSRDQLTASRARLLVAGDHARLRVVRDLHDGAQQRLVQTIMTLKLARQALEDDPVAADAHVARGLEAAERAMTELRELGHGILPSALTHGGLRAAVNGFVSRLDVPVDVVVSSERVQADIEASAYFIVAEALTNVVNHARATRASVTAAITAGVLELEVRDDGVGGADPAGRGLVGVADRVDALGGRLRIESAEGGGTVLAAELPLPHS